MSRQLKLYQNNLQSDINDADPHRIILLMFEGVLARLSTLKGVVERRDLKEKSKLVSSIDMLFLSLQESLDMKSPNDFSENFFYLYDYMRERLMDISLHLDISGIDEIISLLEPIKQAWANISNEDKQKAYIERQKLMNDYG